MADVVAVSQSDFNLLREYKKHPSTELVERYNRVLPFVESFLERLLDPLTALCLREFYINGRSWDDIADIVGCGISDTFRKRSKRFMKGLPL